MPRRSNHVMVLGAGAAGLAAARELSYAGLEATVIEGRDRIGGRIFTVHSATSALPIELGAEFVHGAPEDVLSVVQAAKLILDVLPDNHHVSHNGVLSSLPHFWKKLRVLCAGIGRTVHRKKHDVSVGEYLEKSGLSSRRRAMLRDFVEGFEAGDAGEVSARWVAGAAEEMGSAYPQFRLPAGYDGVVLGLRAGSNPDAVDFRLNTTATELQWKRGAVIVRSVNAAGDAQDPVHGRAAIITLPPALLRNKLVRIAPELRDKEAALEKLGSGQVFKMILQFQNSFWEEDTFIAKRLKKRSSGSGLTFVHAPGGDIHVWWTPSPARAPALTAWAGGPRGASFLAESPHAQIDRTLKSLTQAFGMPRKIIDELLVGSASHDWQADPFSRCAYTYVSVGGMTAPKQLAKPVQGTLFFAGEATDLDEMGTVAGAISSGKRAARECIRALSRRRRTT